MKAPQRDPSWTLSYRGFAPAEEKLREALCALGNGFIGSRASAPEATASKRHYPGTYLAGVYNKLATRVADKNVYNEDMVNCPNWTRLSFRIGDGPYFKPGEWRLASYSQELDMKAGILHRDLTAVDRKGRRTRVRTERLLSMADPHLAAILYEITPENYDGTITIRSLLDAGVANEGVERYRELNNRHWGRPLFGAFPGGGTSLLVRTTQSRVEVAMASRTRVFADGGETAPRWNRDIRPRAEGLYAEIPAVRGKPVSVEKIVSIKCSRGRGKGAPLRRSIAALRNRPRYQRLRADHERAWSSLWEKFDIRVEGDAFAQRVLRLHSFHLIQTASPHNADIDAGFPARGLTGEAYRGHVFWDELYAMFFYELHIPETAKALLMYRYRRLPAARKYARKDGGYRGAMFPWQSASTGAEETQTLHLNPLSGKWDEDLSRRQRHVSFGIAHNVWRYCERTGDDDFMNRHGAEMTFSIARFGSSLAAYDRRTGRYHTKGVMGPDEFHEKLPGTVEPGLRDNAYTNVMIVWTLRTALNILKKLPAGHRARLRRKLGLTDREIGRWDDISRKMNLVIGEGGIVSQFDGYFSLNELNWDLYRKRYKNIHRLDRILKAEGRSPDKFKVSKQADMLMLFYVLRFRDIRDIFHRLGYFFDPGIVPRNYDYYLKRTSHGSTLSRVVHAHLALKLGKTEEVWKWYQDVLRSDIADIQGGTTPEGIHTGVMGGSIYMVYRGFAGVTLRADGVSVAPRLPKRWKEVSFRLLFKGRWFDFRISNETVSVRIAGRSGFPVMVSGLKRFLRPGKTVSFAV